MGVKREISFAGAGCRLLFLFIFFRLLYVGCAIIPSKYDGFLYKGHSIDTDSVIIEAFIDPLCPDCKEAWPYLKEAIHYYSRRVTLVVHPFALPYHDNSFVACRALHIAHKLNASATYPLLEHFFKFQEKFSNQATFHTSRDAVVDKITRLAGKILGNSSLSAIEAGFRDGSSDMATRISFKYGCSRGVTGTPYFLVNGFPLPDTGTDIDYNGWRSIIDPLIGNLEKRDAATYFFL